jgi:hypothetical protein
MRGEGFSPYSKPTLVYQSTSWLLWFILSYVGIKVACRANYRANDSAEPSAHPTADVVSYSDSPRALSPASP